jgi:hypothetical protein
MRPEEHVYDHLRMPRRLMRFTDTLPGNMLAKLDEPANILLIDRSKFDQLTKSQKGQVYVARGDIVWEERAPLTGE